LEGRIGGIDRKDVLEGWIKEMDWRDGKRIGQRDGHKTGLRDVVLLNFRRKSIFAKSEIFAHSLAIFTKNENDFRSYFRENLLSSQP
jgi:hypothetical protein